MIEMSSLGTPRSKELIETSLHRELESPPTINQKITKFVSGHR